MAKDLGLRIRVKRELREEFLAICQAQEKVPAQVIREFMREYLDRYAPKRGAVGGVSDQVTMG